MQHSKPGWSVWWLCLAAACGGGSSVGNPDAGADAGLDAGPEAGLPDPKGCDPLVPSYCGFPYPNDYWTKEDGTTPTGLRLDLPEVIMPATTSTIRSQPAVFNQADGFSPGIAAMAHLPGATVTGLPSPDTIEISLEASSPTVIINADTGERLAHWSELDEYVVTSQELGIFENERPAGELENEKALMIRPAIRPDDATRYIVAIRNVVDESGTALEPSPEFRALRDSTAAEDANVEARREHFEGIFGALADAGVARENLQLAWDFTTASKENNTAWMLHIRDDAFANSPNGVPYNVAPTADEGLLNNIDEELTACVLEFDLEVPLYLDTGEAGGRYVFGADGLPEQNGTHMYKAWMVVPKTAIESPAGLVAFGHGLLGSGRSVISTQGFAAAGNLAFFGLDFSGMASDDVSNIIGVLLGGDLSTFRSVPDRLNQGFLNFLLAMRTFSHEAGGQENLLAETLVNDCMGAQLDGDTRYYFGGSQGGIFGAVLMSLFQDVQRGLIAVPGQSYNLLLNRSVDFDIFSEFVYPLYNWNALDMQMNLALIQGLWDRAEPSGYSKYIRTNRFPNTPAHEIAMQVSMSDHQVTNLGAHIMARTIGGMVNLGEVLNRDVWGIPQEAGEHTGSAMIEVNFGNPPPPLINIPPWEDPNRDPHGRGTEVAPLPEMLNQFYTTGTIENLCNGACDVDDLFD